MTKTNTTQVLDKYPPPPQPDHAGSIPEGW